MLNQERQTSSLGRIPWITSFYLSERKLFSSPLDLLLSCFAILELALLLSAQQTASQVVVYQISDWVGLELLCFLSIKNILSCWRKVGCLTWFQLLKIMLYFIVFFSLYLHVFILSSKMWSKKEAVLSSDTVWPDNFFPPFLSAEMRQKLFGFNAVLRLSHLITWQCCFQLNQMIVLKYWRQCSVGMLDTFT